jgi:hypothetical protein
VQDPPAKRADLGDGVGETVETHQLKLVTGDRAVSLLVQPPVDGRLEFRMANSGGGDITGQDQLVCGGLLAAFKSLDCCWQVRLDDVSRVVDVIWVGAGWGVWSRYRRLANPMVLAFISRSVIHLRRRRWMRASRRLGPCACRSRRSVRREGSAAGCPSPVDDLTPVPGLALLYQSLCRAPTVAKDRLWMWLV